MTARMRILVPGHRGYIGQVLTPLLKAAGHEVVGLDTGYYAGRQFLPEPEVQALDLDLRDVQASDLEGFDAVVFLAALSNDALGDLDASLTHEINDSGTVRFARLAKEAGVRRFVFSSSCSLYGMAGDEVLTEDAGMNPITPYGTAKIEVERQLSALAEAGRFCPVYLRNATAYGVSPALRMDLVVNDLTATAVLRGKVQLLSDGSAWRPLVHVEDIARAMVALLEAPEEVVLDEPFNVGRSEENYLIREVAQLVKDAVPGSEIEIPDRASADARNYRVDFSKIERLVPGFQPQWTVPLGIEQLREAFTQHRLTDGHHRAGRYKRIATLLARIADDQLDDRLRWRRGDEVDGALVPTLVCALGASPEEARAFTRGTIDLQVDPESGVLHNARFDPSLAVYGEAYENSLSVSAVFREYLEGYARQLAERHLGEGGAVLEIGCGDGEFLRHCLQHGATRALGFDPSSSPRTDEDERLELRRELFGADSVALVRELGPRLVVSRQVLEHVVDPVAFLRTLREALEGTEAVLVVEVPSAEFMFEQGTPWEVVYEHRSYFTAESLSHCLAAAGFQPRRVERTFHEQFLSVEAVPARSVAAEAPAQDPRVERWLQEGRARIRRWRERLAGALERGERWGLWGCGARGVTFLNLADPTGAVGCAVDLNALKHGRFVPGTGQRVEAPESLEAFRPTDLVLMNPLYRDEIARDLAQLGLQPRLHTA